MSQKRSHRTTVVSKTKEVGQEKYYISADNLAIIYHAEFYRQLLLICSKTTITVYDCVKMLKINQTKQTTHTASFIPNTNYVVYATKSEEASRKNTMAIWDYQSNQITCKMTLTFQIQTIKASRRCILLQSAEQLYVIHFATLRPIYNGYAGNGFRIICDISRQGLTLAHDTEKKGQILVKNFTNIKTNKLLSEIRSQPRSMSINSRIKSRQSRLGFKMQQKNDEPQIKHQVSIPAHKQAITIIKLSPNGYRLVSASIKGTVIRLYSCLNGQLISEYLMCRQLCSIIDINFISDGNAIACLNEKNEVKLFHTKFSELQLISQTARRGYEVYERQNPKSMFSFLGFFNQNLLYQQPFSYFLLSTKTIEMKQKKSQMNSPSIKSNSRNQISEIPQGPVNRQEASSGSVQIRHEEPVKVYTETITQQITIQDAVQLPKNESSNEIKIIVNNVRQKSPSRLNMERPMSNRKKKVNGSLKSLSLLNRKQNQFVIINKNAERSLNFKGIIYFDDTTNVKILRSKYFYKLKYDPFNGGQMFESDSFNLLNHPLFKNL